MLKLRYAILGGLAACTLSAAAGVLIGGAWLSNPEPKAAGESSPSHDPSCARALAIAYKKVEAAKLLLQDGLEVHIKRSTTSSGWVVEFLNFPLVEDTHLVVWVYDNGEVSISAR